MCTRLWTFIFGALISFQLQAQEIEQIDHISEAIDASRPSIAFTHGGRNGGDGVEAEIRIMAKRIVSYISSQRGRSVFPEINVEHLNRVMKIAKFFVTSEVLVDRFGIKRTCTNNPVKMDVICNINRWGLVKDPRVYYVLIFHEILGLMNLELGHNHDVSMYPISSKLIDNVEEVINSPLAIRTLTPEYYSLERLSLGSELVNKRTDETIRLICFDNVEVHLCDQYVFVRKYKGRQAPVATDLKPLTIEQLRDFQKELNSFKRKPYVEGDVLEVVELLENALNVNRSFSLMGSKKEIKKHEFKNMENLLSLILTKIGEKN